MPTITPTRGGSERSSPPSPRVALDLATVQSNILVFSLRDGAPDAAAFVARAKENGVLLFAFGPRTVRAVTIWTFRWAVLGHGRHPGRIAGRA